MTFTPTLPFSLFRSFLERKEVLNVTPDVIDEVYQHSRRDFWTNVCENEAIDDTKRVVLNGLPPTLYNIFHCTVTGSFRRSREDYNHACTLSGRLLPLLQEKAMSHAMEVSSAQISLPGSLGCLRDGIHVEGSPELVDVQPAATPDPFPPLMNSLEKRVVVAVLHCNAVQACPSP